MNPDTAATMKHAIDPVCKMIVNVDAKTIQVDHGVHAHYFCSQECKNTFEKDPKKYH